MRFEALGAKFGDSGVLSEEYAVGFLRFIVEPPGGPRPKLDRGAV
jgi:hypothetical protein